MSWRKDLERRLGEIEKRTYEVREQFRNHVALWTDADAKHRPASPCMVCGKMDFHANMKRLPNDDYAHAECDRNARKVKTCPTCKGKGEVDKDKRKK